MAADDIVQRIVVEGADQATAAFDQIEKGAIQALGGIANIVSGLAGELGPMGVAFGAAAGAVGGFVAAMESMVETASNAAASLRGLAALSGSSVEDMGALKGAFAEAGVSADGLQTSFRRFSQAVSTEMPKVRQEMASAGDTIASANLKAQEAVNALNKVMGESATYYQHDIDIKKTQIAVTEAQRAATEAAANDIRKFVQYFDDLANGVQKSTDGMNMSLANLKKGIIGSLGESADALQSFDGSLRKIGQDPSAHDQLLKLADIFHNMPDGIQKTALTLQIFGRSAGPDLIAFLNQGSAAIKEHEDRIKALGLTLTTVESGALKDFRIASFTLSEELGVLKEKFAAVISPVFTQALDNVRKFLEDHMELWRSLGEAAKTALTGMFGLLGDLINDLKVIVDYLDKIRVAWTAMFKGAGGPEALSFIAPLRDGLQFVINMINRLVAELAGAFAKLSGYSEDSVNKLKAGIYGIGEANRAAFGDLQKQFDAGKISLGEFLVAVQKLQNATLQVADASKQQGDAATDAGKKTEDAATKAAAKQQQINQAWKDSAGDLDVFQQKLAQINAGTATVAATNTKTSQAINQAWIDSAGDLVVFQQKLAEINAGTAALEKPTKDVGEAAKGAGDAAKDAGDKSKDAFKQSAASADEYKGKLDEVKTKTTEIAAPKVDWSPVIQTAQTAVSQITQAFSSANFFGSLSGQIDALISKFQELAQAARDAAEAASQAASSGGGSDGLPMATGGLFVGRNGGIDSNLAWLTSGEFVMSTRAVQHWGTGLMHSINQLRAPKFAAGGLNMVTPRQSPVGGAGPSTTGQRVLNLSIEGRSFSGLSIPERTAQSLERFAVHSQIASAGRKPSWRR